MENFNIFLHLHKYNFKIICELPIIQSKCSILDSRITLEICSLIIKFLIKIKIVQHNLYNY